MKPSYSCHVNRQLVIVNKTPITTLSILHIFIKYKEWKKKQKKKLLDQINLACTYSKY